MRKAARRVRSLSLTLTVTVFFARINSNGTIQFESVEL